MGIIKVRAYKGEGLTREGVMREGYIRNWELIKKGVYLKRKGLEWGTDLGCELLWQT